jgi:hypothetical protein
MKRWKQWLLAAAVAMTPAAALAANHVSAGGCGCPWCPF